jgi:hypothetical protein
MSFLHSWITHWKLGEIPHHTGEKNAEGADGAAEEAV